MTAENLICPVSGKEIGPGEGNAVGDSKGNLWIVHNTVKSVRTDSPVGPATVGGEKPFMGPDA
jgi:hypothetical protein